MKSLAERLNDNNVRWLCEQLKEVKLPHYVSDNEIRIRRGGSLILVVCHPNDMFRIYYQETNDRWCDFTVNNRDALLDKLVDILKGYL